MERSVGALAGFDGEHVASVDVDESFDGLQAMMYRLSSSAVHFVEDVTQLSHEQKATKRCEEYRMTDPSFGWRWRRTFPPGRSQGTPWQVIR